MQGGKSDATAEKLSSLLQAMWFTDQPVPADATAMNRID